MKLRRRKCCAYLVYFVFVIGFMSFLYRNMLTRQLSDIVLDRNRNSFQVEINPVTKQQEQGSVQKFDPQHGIEAVTKQQEQGSVQMKPGELGNFEPRDYPARSGPGEDGDPVETLPSEIHAVEDSYTQYGFNQYASDKVALNRTVPDTRLEECKYWHYPEDLPSASVIIVFYNELWSTLLRTVHSVINTSPPHLLHEVVMLDDCSDKHPHTGRLEEYIQKFDGKVKLYRNKERTGLMLARTLGARYATGDVIVFLDAHCECNRNWLPPLLARVAYDRHIMAVPIVEVIGYFDFIYKQSAYMHGDANRRGIFEWGFLFKESEVPKREKDRHQFRSEPYWSPTHAGGLFAMDRLYFFELGAYDPNLYYWGGENYELSFKIWQCGGSIEWVPCSRVGHVYKHHSSRSAPAQRIRTTCNLSSVLQNYIRVAETWLDEFKEYFYTEQPMLRGCSPGNISAQLEFKKKHNCKSFKWYIENIAYEVPAMFPFPPPNRLWGQVQHTVNNLCWQFSTNTQTMKMVLLDCRRTNSIFRLNTESRLATGEWCVDILSHEDTLSVSRCGTKTTGPWELDDATGLMRHTEGNVCVEAAGEELVMRHCDPSNNDQTWQIIPKPALA